MWIFDTSLWQIVFRTALVYVVVLIGIRLTGKREVGQMTPFDLVLLLLIANAVQNAMTGPDTSLTGGWTAAITLLVVNALVSKMTWHSKWVRHFVEGTPTLLIHHGKILTANLAKEQVTLEELDQAIREHGIASLDHVELATLEVDGAISVLRKDEMPTTHQPHHHIRFLRKRPN